MQIIKLTAVIAGLLFILSCNSGKSDTHTKVPSVIQQQAPDTTSRQPRLRNLLTDVMQKQMIEHYRNEYGGDSIKMSVSYSDTLMEVSFADTTGDEDAYHGPLFTAYISLVTDIDPVLRGDVNGDGKPDLLVSVHTEGGGGGGNVWWSDHFLFLAESDALYALADVKSDGELMEGFFFPRSINNQVITGIGNAYDETDGRCCPSLYYQVQVKFTPEGLKMISRTAIEKPADFE